MNNLFLENFSDLTEDEIKTHLAIYYGGAGYNYKTGKYELDCEIEETLKLFNIIIAYEEEGNYEGRSWFLFKKKETNELYELYASHCSCYGFENQFDLEKTSKEFLLDQKKYFIDRKIPEFLKEYFT